MGYGDNVPMQMPSLCARCGEKPPTSSIGITAKHRSFGSRITNVMNFSVPVCTDCQAKIAQRDKNAKIVMGVGVVIFLIGLALLVPYFLTMNNPEMAVQGAALMNQYWPYGVVALVGLLLAMTARKLAEPSFAKWNGSRFRFNNKAFHAAFANLNPSISRKA
jgi:hypothetical protein